MDQVHQARVFFGERGAAQDLPVAVLVVVNVPDRCAVEHDRQVSDQTGVEEGVQVGTVGAGTLRAPTDVRWNRPQARGYSSSGAGASDSTIS